MSEIFNENNMMHVLNNYIPDNENLIAGIHANAKEVCVKEVFKNCVYNNGIFSPAEDGDTLEFSKQKYSMFDVYIGITENHLIISQCENYRWYYEIDTVNSNADNAVEISGFINETDIGICYTFDDIKSCTIKKAWMGSFNCLITMKNGSYFKLQLPKLAGLGGGMPHHKEWRDVLIKRLTNI
ncbi:MAG: hypothetical protein K2I14_09460 [Eubacterium sp.]|nr:hypothetical protein [Eubacterium sp.]